MASSSGASMNIRHHICPSRGHSGHLVGQPVRLIGPRHNIGLDARLKGTKAAWRDSYDMG